MSPESSDTAAMPTDLTPRCEARALGWYCGNCHLHLWRRGDAEPVTLEDAAARARAQGLDFLLVTPPWEEAQHVLTAEEMTALCNTVAIEGLALHWSLEAPKCPIPVPVSRPDGNRLSHGHGWAVGLQKIPENPRFFTTGPNFPILQEIHRQGGVCGCAHPLRMRLKEGMITAGPASELPFDFFCGAGYDAMDLLGPPEDDPGTAERVWWALLNLGYRVAATANTGGWAGRGASQRFRTFVRMRDGFSWPGLVKAIRGGACVASSGPLALFDIDGAEPGSELPANDRPRTLHIRAWADPAVSGPILKSVQLIRNGEIVRIWNLAGQNLAAWQGACEIRETDFAWYALRVMAGHDDGHAPASHAIASPIYLIPPMFTRPAPAEARVRLRVCDTADRDIACRVITEIAGRETLTLDLPAGQTVITVPAGARLIIRSPGYADEIRTLYGDSPLGDYCRDLNLARLALDAPRVWQEMRQLLDQVDLQVRLLKVYSFSKS